MKVAVGSTNAVKIESVKAALAKVWPDETWDVQGIDVASGVPDQPMGAEESIAGAKNRALAAISELDADYGVGLEGGIEEVEGTHYCTGWVAVVDRTGTVGLGSSGRTPIPPMFMESIRKGMELSQAYEEVSHEENSKQKQGFNGFMSLGALNRTEAFTFGTIAALGRFTRRTLF